MSHARIKSITQTGNSNRRYYMMVVFFIMIAAGFEAIRSRNFFFSADTDQAFDDRLFFDGVKNICSTQLFQPGNKPAGMIIDYHQGQPVPSTCIPEVHGGDFDKIKCLTDYAALEKITFTVPKELLQARDETDKFGELLKTSIIDRETLPIIKTMTTPQTGVYVEAIARIMKIEMLQRAALDALRINVGLCGEFSQSSIFRLLQLSSSYKSNLVIQEVSVEDKIGNTHGFVMINSNRKDIELQNNERAVTKYLQSVKGYICDNWNEGLFIDASSNRNNLYRNGWNKLTVTTISLYFNLTALNNDGKAYLEKRLARLGLINLHKKPVISLFDIKSESNNTAVEKKASLRM